MNRSFRRAFTAETKHLTQQQFMDVVKITVENIFDLPLSGSERLISDQTIKDLDGFQFYHGGLSGRAVGDVLLPSLLTGQDPRNNGAAVANRSAHVFATVNLDIARTYARDAKGSVYLVKPQNIVEVDENDLRRLVLIADNRAFRDKHKISSSRHARKILIEGYPIAIKCRSALVLEVLE